MAKNIKGGKWSSKQSRLGAGLSLEKFSKAKQSSFDRRKAKKDKHKALKAAKINKYRKLKERLRTEGRLQPVLPSSNTVDKGEEVDKYGDTQRALARAGPAPEEDDSLKSEFVGEATPPLEKVAAASHTKGLGFQEQKQLPYSGQTGLKQEGPKQAKMKKRKRKPQPEAQQAAEEVSDREGDTERAASMADKTSEGQQHVSESPKAVKRKKKQKPPSQVQRLAERVQREKDKKRLANEKAEQEAEERQRRRAATEKERKKRNKLFLQKTRRGQPVMKHRIDKVLEKLQAEQG